MSTTDVQGRRVIITGAARGIGALTARKLHERGARVALMGIEPELLAGVAADCGGAPWRECDVRDRGQVDRAVEELVAELGGLDVAVANAGIAAQLPIVGGDPKVFEQTVAVNLMGAYYLARAAGPHVSHPGGYVLFTASMAAAVHLPLLSAYCASKAGVEALGNSLRTELRPTGAKVGVAYFSELDTDMTSRGFDTQAARRMPLGGHGHLPVAPVEPAIDAVVAGIARRSRQVVSPRRNAVVLPIRAVAQRVVELVARRGLAKTLEIARQEHPEMTTPQPEKVDSAV